jgi:RHS repeat-associated protein
VGDSLGSQPVVDYTYLADGKVDHADYRNGVRSAYQYDGRGMTRVVDHYRIAGTEDLSWREYTRDARDRITSFRKGTSGYNPMENGRGDRFWYDAEGQLTDAYYNAVDPAGNPQGQLRQEHFEYDQLGNRRRNPANGADNLVGTKGWLQFTRKDNGLNQYSGWWPYCFIKYDDDLGGGWGTPQHANGVLMQDGWITAGYNALNQPMLATSNSLSGNWMFFGHDPLGRCVKRWVAPLPSDGSLMPPPNSNPATYFYYDGWNLIQEGPSSSIASRNYIHGARVDDIVKSITYGMGGQEAYQHYDARGHCTLVTTSTGNILEQYEYDAFGYPNFCNSSGTNATASSFGNRFLFTGREWLSDLKLYDYRNRLYQPELGRFMQPDPKQFAAGDYNLYRYCHNDPINKVDPMGLRSPDSTWDRQMWLQNGSKLTLADFTLVKHIMEEPPSFIRREETGHWHESVKKGGNTFHRAHTNWRLTLLNKEGKATYGAGILVDERIDQHTDAIDYAGSGQVTSKHETYPGGWVGDNWALLFSSLKGRLTTVQTILVAGREATWEATTTAEGEVDHAQYSAPFR